MAEEEFEDWDADFLDKVIQVEELALSATQQRVNSIQPQPQPQPFPQPPPFPHHPIQQFPARLGFDASYSPPRELSQRPIESRRVKETVNGGVAVAPKPVAAPVARSARGGVARGITDMENEIHRLKKELERKNKQVEQQELECLQLRKERDEKEVQLQSSAVLREAAKSGTQSWKNASLDFISPTQECYGVPAGFLDQNVSNDQGGSRYGPSSYHTKGVQTEMEADDVPSPSDKEVNAFHIPSEKLQAIRRSSTYINSARYLASRLIVACAADLQVLSDYRTDSLKSKEIIDDRHLSEGMSVDNEKLICSSEAAKVSRFSTVLAEMNSGDARFESFYSALLDLFSLQNAAIIYRSLRILRVVLKPLTGFRKSSERRNNLVFEDATDVPNSCGTKQNKAGSPSTATIVIDEDTDGVWASEIYLPFIECVSLFELMHQISLSVGEEPIIYEAISIMTVIQKRYIASERERFGQIGILQSIPKFLKKEIGLRVQSEAVRLIFLLINCPALLASLYSEFKEKVPNSLTDKDVSAVGGLYAIFAGLEDCLTCCGTGIEALELRREAIILLGYLVSFGTSGFEVLWSSTICNKVCFLVSVVRLLAAAMDAEMASNSEPTSIVKERALLVREALIFLNRIVSHPAYSGAALRALTNGRDITGMTINVGDMLSRKGRTIREADSITRQTIEFEIPDLARVFFRRVAAYLGENIQL